MCPHLCWYLTSYCQFEECHLLNDSSFQHFFPLPSEGSYSSSSLILWDVESWCGWTWQLCWIKPQLWPLLLRIAIFSFWFVSRWGNRIFILGGELPLIPFLNTCEKALYFCGFVVTSRQAATISVGGTSLADVYRRLWLLLCQTMHWCVAQSNETVQKAGNRLTIMTLLTNEHSKMLMMCLFLHGRRTIWLTSSKFLW